MKLLKDQDHEEAVVAFKRCLRLEPNSAKAHLQLGMLYEDVFTDPLQAIYHYRRYLDERPDGEDADAVRRWTARAEKAYLAHLLGRHGGSAPERSFGDGTPVTPPSATMRLRSDDTHAAAKAVPLPDPSVGARPTARERLLVQRIKELNDEVLVLRSAAASRQASAQPHAPVPDERQPEPGLDSTAPAHAARTPVRSEPTHVVVPGDSLSNLARKYYGHLKYWPLLRDYNHDTLQGRQELITGMRLRIPPLSELTGAETSHKIQGTPEHAAESR